MVNDLDKTRAAEEQSTVRRAKLLGVRYIDSRKLGDLNLVEGLMTKEQMYETKMVPLAKGQSVADFAITIGTPQRAVKELRSRLQDYNISFMMMSDSGFKEMMLRHDPPEVVTYSDISIKSEGDSENIANISATLDTIRSDDILTYLIDQADLLNASDIHLECEKDHTRMRFRVDGALHSVGKLTKEKFTQLQMSIAVVADISSTAPDAQTGHFNQEITRDGKVKTVNMRIETVPTNYGQDAVIRLFSMDASLLKLESLGLDERELGTIQRLIDHPHGMMLVVGPTGSGKTTTLYSSINRLNSPSRKIITLEDPVEYGFEGISQIQVNTRSGDSFAEKLRAVLRQDPDVIMLGEIRDSDTAKTALQASLTGHLVLSTFHADSATAALSRLFDMIGANPMLSSAIKLIIAQRLVRKLDEGAREAYTPEQHIIARVTEVIESLPDGIERPSLDNLQLFRPKPNDENPFGYKGRMMIMEQLVVDEPMQALLNDSARSHEAINAHVVGKGMVTMLQDGVLKAIRGETSIEEVFRVVD